MYQLDKARGQKSKRKTMAAAIADILVYCVAFMAIVRRHHCICILQLNITHMVLGGWPCCCGDLINWSYYSDIGRKIITMYGTMNKVYCQKNIIFVLIRSLFYLRDLSQIQLISSITGREKTEVVALVSSINFFSESWLLLVCPSIFMPQYIFLRPYQ